MKAFTRHAIVRAAAVMLVLAMVGSLAGCGGYTIQIVPKTTPTPMPEAPVEITPEPTPAVTPQPTAAPTPVPTPEPAPTPVPVPQSYELSFDCTAPMEKMPISFNYTFTVNGSDSRGFFMNWASVTGNINDKNDPERIFRAANACVEELPFSMPADSEYKDIAFNTDIDSFDFGTYTLTFLAELPGLSETGMLSLTVVPECTGSYVKFLGENNEHNNVCLIVIRFDLGHEHSWKRQVWRDATCTEPGLCHYECACGAKFNQDEPAALGHAWGRWDINNYTHTKTCGRCGIKNSGDHVFGDVKYDSEEQKSYRICGTCGYRLPIYY